MMGAVMQTVNVSLIPEDIAYTINDTGATTVLFNADFLPLMEKLKDHLKAVEDLRPDARPPRAAADGFPDQVRIRGAAVARLALLPVPGFRRERLRDRFSTRPERRDGRRASIFSHRQMVLHTLAGLVEYGLAPEPGPLPSRRRLHADDADVPRARLGLPVHGDALGMQDGLSGPLFAGDVPEADRDREGDVHPLRADHPADAAGGAGQREGRSFAV